jgi:hypothetical protein
MLAFFARQADEELAAGRIGMVIISMA